MKRTYGLRYQPTSSYGNSGDMCVDGVLNYDTAFAVYAPEIYKDKNAVSKLRSDFYGFMEHRKNGRWKQIQKYIFVIKRERTGVTSAVLDLISQFSVLFPVEIMTLDDLKMMERNYLPFSEDGRLLLELKKEITEILEYIIQTDFAAEPFYMSLSDDIKNVIAKWSQKQYSFQGEKPEELKNRILNALGKLCNYLTPLYVHVLLDGRLLFNNDSWEAGERLRNEMRPQTLRIRQELHNLLNDLHDLK